jgi:1-aminocyclopropane-1-carboxylate deaminase
MLLITKITSFLILLIHIMSLTFFQHTPSPLQRIHHTIFTQQDISLFIKRDDLLHSTISGNKWRKLKYNALAALEQGKTILQTYGGAYSNHIYAVAALGQALNMKTIGIITIPGGVPPAILSETLQFAIQCGMELQFVSKQTYRVMKATPPNNNENIYDIPEGGSNSYALLGCAELVIETLTQATSPFDYWCVSGGTGGTAAGMLTALPQKAQLLVLAALKGDFLIDDITKLLQLSGKTVPTNWELITDYHFGGYAKCTAELFRFITDFYNDHSILLDPIYTGKLLYGIFDLSQKGFFPKGSRIVAVHTGGLQGWSGKREYQPK